MKAPQNILLIILIIFECVIPTKFDLIKRLEKLGYKVFDAKNLSEDLSHAYDFFALPAVQMNRFQLIKEERENYFKQATRGEK